MPQPAPSPNMPTSTGYPLTWLGQRCPEDLDQQSMTDLPAPELLRVNGPLANLLSFTRRSALSPGTP